METLESYIENLNEDFGFEMKAFKANLLQKMAKGIKQNVKDNKVNVDAIKKILKPIPAMAQEKINKFLSKYVPNYIHNYNIAEKHFKNKYPTEHNINSIAGAVAISTSVEKDKTIQQQIKRAERIYSKHIGAGGPFVILIIILGILMLVFSVADVATGGTSIMAALLGGFLILSSVLIVVRENK